MENEGAIGAGTGFTSIEMVHTHAPQQRGFLWKTQQGRGNLSVVQRFKMPIAATEYFVVGFTGDLLHVPKFEVTGRWYAVEPSGSS